MLRVPSIVYLGQHPHTQDHRFMLLMETHGEAPGRAGGQIYRADVIVPCLRDDNNALLYAAAMRDGWQKIVKDIIANRAALQGDEWMGQPSYAVPQAREPRKESLWSRLRKWAGTLIPKRNSGAR